MRLLLVEDKDSFRRLLVQALEGGAWDVTAVGAPKEALEALAASPYDLLLTDLRLPGMSGLDLLKAAKRARPALRAVVMSAFGEPRDIVEAIRWGADDFLTKPFDLDVLAGLLDRLRALAEAPPPDPREPWIVHAPVMAALDQALTKAAATSIPVLFHGEAGTGKARAARRLHTLRHPQAPFLAMAASTVVPGLKELALLQGGSLYVTDLDPCGDGAALVAAMDSPAGRRVHWMGGCPDPQALPEALRLRLGPLTFRLAPLRERREDLLPIFRAFLERQARREGRPVPIVERSLERDLLQRPWPGNIRQLTWALVQSLGATTGAVLAPLPPEGAQRGGVLILPYPAPGPLEAMLDAVVRDAAGALLRRAMDGRRGDPAAVAQELGLTPRALAKALKDHAIPLEEGTP